MVCEKCKKNVKTYNSVISSDEGTSQRQCMDCFNAKIEDMIGVKTQDLIVKQIIMTDEEKNSYTFDIIKFLTPTGIALEAKEITSENEGYEFSVLGSIDCDIGVLFKKLYEKVEQGIKTKYIDENGIKADVVLGRIEWDDNSAGKLPLIVIDFVTPKKLNPTTPPT